jgi:hypothetical protein
VERPKKPAPEEVLMAWAREWAEEGVAVDWQELLPQKLRGVAEEVGGGANDRLGIDQQRRMKLGITSGWSPLARRSSMWR